MSLPDKKFIFYFSYILIIIIIVFGLIQFLDIDKIPFIQREKVLYNRTEFLLDTVVNIKLYSEDEQKASETIGQVFSLIKKWEEKLDRHQEDSLISRLNNEGEQGIEVPQGFIDMLTASYKYYEISDGVFDPTVTPVLKLWGFGQKEHQVPEEKELEKALEKVGFEKIEIDRENNIVYLPREMSLDLGAVAKGFIINEVMALLEEKGIESAVLNAGGNIGIRGEKPDRPWYSGIRNPRKNEIYSEYRLAITEGSLATSGDYQRYFIEDGIRYSHLINARTGHQQREMYSSTIYAKDAMKADILSTTVFVMGWEKGKKLIEETPGVEGFLVREDEIWYSSGFASFFVD